MIDSRNGDDADRRAAEIGAVLQELAPRLTLYFRSRIGHRTERCHHVVEDLIQTTMVQALLAANDPAIRILDPLAYVWGVAKNCLKAYFERTARQPKPIDNLELFVDPSVPLPDQAVEDREVCEMARPALLRLSDWRSRFLPALIVIGGQLHELDGIREDLSPLFGFDQHARKRTRGRPTKIQEVGLILEELPGKIALLTEFFQEP